MTIHYKSFLLDELSTIGIYSILKENITNESIHLFESVGGDNSSSSIFTIGVREKVISKNAISTYTNECGKTQEVQQNPLLFLRDYYKNIDKKEYSKLAKQLKVKFIDGFIGYIGYDMIKYFEPKLEQSMNELEDTLGLDDFNFIRPKIIITFIHSSSTIVITTTDNKYKSMVSQIQDMLLNTVTTSHTLQKTNINDIQYHHSKNEFINMVKECKKMIKSGDVFQVLLSNRAQIKSNMDYYSFYRVLRSINPSPYMFFINYDDFAIIGSSPEILTSLQNGIATLNPIAGTRKRGIDEEEDKKLQLELLNDKKEVAEHIMLVDLGRNDLGKISIAGSVKPKKLMSVEKYSHVMHIVSSINSKIDDSKYDMFDLIMATFTAGTMTGTPKIRAMELIAQYEKLKRSFYSGAIGYFGFDGNMDSAITIRTACLNKETITLQAGAGIVADSVPELEYLEVKNKLNALLKTIEILKSN